MPASHTNELIDDLEQLDEVIRLTAIREGSIKPPGDVLMVHTLSRGADKVMRLADTIREHGQVSISTHELTSIVDPEHHDKVSNDVDEALWEEAETGLRHQSRITPNYLALMALGGTIATIALVVESETQQAMAIVAASIVAPGFEPLAKMAMGPSPASLGRGQKGSTVRGRRLP